MASTGLRTGDSTLASATLAYLLRHKLLEEHRGTRCVSKH